MSIPAWARKGAKVVYVDDSPGYIESGNLMRLREVYTLIEVTDEFSEPACRVTGAGLQPWEFMRLSRFRPLISQADDISTHFQALLSTPVKKEEDA